MSEKEVCGTCKHSRYDAVGEDFVCSNSRSEHFADWIPYNTTCDEWEAKGCTASSSNTKARPI